MEQSDLNKSFFSSNQSNLKTQRRKIENINVK